MPDPPRDADDTPPPLPTHKITWAVLLGRWVDFARSAVALPDTGDAARVRQSVPDIIMLQAVWFALQHLEELDPAQRAFGLDRAEVLIERHADALRQRWPDDRQLPEQISDLILDAWQQLKAMQKQYPPPDNTQSAPPSETPDL